MTSAQLDEVLLPVDEGRREVVVGVSASDLATSVLAHAVREAATTQRPLRVVHAWTTPVWTGDLSGMSVAFVPSKTESAAAATQLSARLIEESGTDLPAVPFALEGTAGQALVALAEDAGLLVIGGRGHGSLVNAVLGSATLHALHHAASAVMVVPTSAPPTAGYARVVVGLDASPCSRSALRWGLDAARRHGCPVVVVHVQDEDAEVLDVHWVQDEVTRVLRGEDHVQVSTAVEHGHPTRRLLEIAGPSDLLVLGSRGRGGFAGLMLGSTAAQVAQHARSVVTVVRAGAERLAVPE